MGVNPPQAGICIESPIDPDPKRSRVVARKLCQRMSSRSSREFVNRFTTFTLSMHRHGPHCTPQLPACSVLYLGLSTVVSRQAVNPAYLSGSAAVH